MSDARPFNHDEAHADVYNHLHARYEQGRCYYDVQYRQVDPATGALIGEAPAAPEAEVDTRPKVAPEPPPIATEVKAAARAELSGMDISKVNLDEAHWRQLQHMLEAFGQSYTGKDSALAFLSAEQARQREALGI